MFQYLNVELTNDCNKSCHFCGRAHARKNKLMKTGSMPAELFAAIVEGYKGSIMQFNKDGEPLMYPHLRWAGEITSHLVTNIVTNGKLLWEKKDDLINNFTSITVSVYEDDKEQLEIVRKFVDYLGDRKPKVLIKFLGKYENKDYEDMGLTILRRSIHDKLEDRDYKESVPPIPELGVCLDFLLKPSIDYRGNMFICNRYDPYHKGSLGNITKDTIEWLWNSPLRQKWLDYHKKGRRDLIPLCKTCTFWGIPTNG